MILVGHRGAAFEYPENTINGFIKTFQAGVHAFELDLRLTADHEVVIIHDSDTDRTCDRDIFIRDMTLADIQHTNAAHNSNVPFEPIPLLRQMLPLFEQCHHIQLEIKSDVRDVDAYEIIFRELNHMMVACDTDKYFITSGHNEPLAVAAQICPHIKRGFIYKDLKDSEVSLNEWDIAVCDWEFTDRAAIEQFEQSYCNVPLAIHGINKRNDIDWFEQRNNVYVITDRPMRYNLLYP